MKPHEKISSVDRSLHQAIDLGHVPSLVGHADVVMISSNAPMGPPLSRSLFPLQAAWQPGSMQAGLKSTG